MTFFNAKENKDLHEKILIWIFRYEDEDADEDVENKERKIEKTQVLLEVSQGNH